MTLRDFRQDFNLNLSKLAGLAGSLASDLAEQIQSPLAKKGLGYALDLIRPHFISLGARIAVLSATQIELNLPRKSRNIGTDGYLLPGVQISAAIEAYRLLWFRNAPEGEFQVSVRNVKTQFLRPAHGDLKLRGELSEISRESRWAELTKNKRSSHQMTLHVFDAEEQIVAEVEIESELFLNTLLEWK
jgi:hypothetical protein